MKWIPSGQARGRDRAAKPRPHSPWAPTGGGRYRYCHRSDRAEHIPAATGGPGPVDLVVTGADLVVTMDAGREVRGGWVAVDDGFVVGIGAPGTEPPARRPQRDGCLVTPGLVNTHHHIYQNLTRSFAPAVRLGPVRLAPRPVPALGAARRGSRLPFHLRGPGRTGAGWVHDDDRPLVRAPCRRRRPAGGGDRRRPRGRPPFPPDPGVDERLGKGRGPAAGLGVRGRRHHPGRVARPPCRPTTTAPRSHGAGGAGAVFPVHGQPPADVRHSRTGRAPRRQVAHPSG